MERENHIHGNDRENWAKDATKAKLEQVKDESVRMAEEAKKRGRQQIEEGKEHAADQIEGISAVLERTSAELSEKDQPSIAAYTGDLASKVDNLAKKFRELSVEEMLRETQDYARREPGVFLAGSVALGFALSRFFKATSRSAEESVNMGSPHQQEACIPEPPGNETSRKSNATGVDRTYADAGSDRGNSNAFDTRTTEESDKKGV